MNLLPVFLAPDLDAREASVIDAIDALRTDLRHQVAAPRRWVGSLRRTAIARAVQGSNSIEGYVASLADVAATVDGEASLDASDETRAALSGYRDALTYVQQSVSDSTSGIDQGLLKALHFMMIRYDLDKRPGQWRRGPVSVRREDTGEVVYAAPPHEDVPVLVASMLDGLTLESSTPVIVRAAMAHLNLVMVHPFADGNGRMGRALQTLVLARDRILSPVFSSIEEYLGRNTPAYYDVLAAVGQGAWNPQRNARPWVRFCLTAHLRQAASLLRRVRATEELWNECSVLAERHGLAERGLSAMTDAAQGLRIRRASYRRLAAEDGAEITDLTASRDLKALVDADVLTPIGERRGRYYVAAPALVGIWLSIRARRPARDDRDPFVEPLPGQGSLSLG